jgi:hypothetical protein
VSGPSRAPVGFDGDEIELAQFLQIALDRSGVVVEDVGEIALGSTAVSSNTLTISLRFSVNTRSAASCEHPYLYSTTPQRRLCFVRRCFEACSSTTRVLDHPNSMGPVYKNVLVAGRRVGQGMIPNIIF